MALPDITIVTQENQTGRLRSERGMVMVGGEAVAVTSAGIVQDREIGLSGDEIGAGRGKKRGIGMGMVEEIATEPGAGTGIGIAMGHDEIMSLPNPTVIVIDRDRLCAMVRTFVQDHPQKAPNSIETVTSGP